MIKTQTFTNETDILIAPELAFALPCIVANDSVSANEEGRKIIKAGTPLYADADIFMNRQTVLKTSGTTAYGIARWDIDVTDGNTNATILIDGYVDYLKLDKTVQSTIDTAKSNLTTIRFIKGRAL